MWSHRYRRAPSPVRLHRAQRLQQLLGQKDLLRPSKHPECTMKILIPLQSGCLLAVRVSDYFRLTA